jgi:hypothetical protein
MSWIWAVALGIGLALAGCESDDSEGNGGGGGGGGSTLDQPLAVPVTAAEGGTITAGTAKLVIPAGALAEDTTITVEEVATSGFAGKENIAAAVLEFGPDGLTFSQPVQMEMAFDASKAPEGSVAKLAWYDGSKWVELEDSAVSGGKVTATTTHFTPFTVVWVSGQGQVGGSCDSLAYAPCGGNLEGTWEYTLGCIDYHPTEELMPECEGVELSAELDIEGTITFNANATYSRTGSQTMTITIRVPKSCLPPAASCTMLEAEDDGDFCKMVQVDEEPLDTEDGTYSTDGSTLTVDDSDSAMTYCVDGGELMVEVGDDDFTGIYKATKQ